MIDAIVLAAGLATRMGEIKPLTPIEGEPALSRILHMVGAAGIVRPIVVLGSRSAQQIEQAIDLTECVVVINDVPEAGMSRSLRLGLEAVSPEATGILVLHADMPFVRTETVRTVMRAADRGAQIAAPFHLEQRGFPVFFHRSRLSGLLRSLSGDVGGRAYIEAHRKELMPVDVADPGCVYDIDRPEDLAAWKGDCACATTA